MNLVERLDEIENEMNQNFSLLNATQLNWKESPGKWSIAQCLHHLITANQTYFTSFDQLLAHNYQLSFLQKLNPFKKMFGPMMINSLGAVVKKKFKAPQMFEPTSSELSPTIVAEFSKHQQILKDYFKKLVLLDTKNLVITSPVSKLITYTLHDGLQIIVGHEQRHIKQANNILNDINFPK